MRVKDNNPFNQSNSTPIWQKNKEMQSYICFLRGASSSIFNKENIYDISAAPNTKDQGLIKQIY